MALSKLKQPQRAECDPLMKPFFLFFCIVSNFNIIKTLTLLVHAGLFQCFHSPPNSDMDYRIFKMHIIYEHVIFLIAYIYIYDIYIYYYASGDLCFIHRTFVESAQNLTLEKSQGGCKA